MRSTARVLCLALISAVILTFAACSKGEKNDEETDLTPVQIINEIFTLTKAKDYDKVAGYCRSFSPYSVELYFTDTGTSPADYDKIITGDLAQVGSDLLVRLAA